MQVSHPDLLDSHRWLLFAGERLTGRPGCAFELPSDERLGFGVVLEARLIVSRLEDLEVTFHEPI